MPEKSKALLFRLALVGVVAVAVWRFAVSSNRSEQSVSWDPPGSSSSAASQPADPAVREIERRVFELTNRERAKHRLPAVRSEDVLAGIARSHSADMLRRGYFAHDNPDGESASDRAAFGHRRLIGVVGENIWSGTGYHVAEAEALASTIVESWMTSPGHRENILRPMYTHLGVGVAAAGDEIRATQNFAMVRAYLTAELPVILRRGATPELGMTSPDSSLPTARLVTLWSPRSEKDVAEPQSVDEVLIEAAPGTYGLRFFFPDGSAHSFKIFYGPQVQVR